MCLSPCKRVRRTWQLGQVPVTTLLALQRMLVQNPDFFTRQALIGAPRFAPSCSWSGKTGRCAHEIWSPAKRYHWLCSTPPQPAAAGHSRVRGHQHVPEEEQPHISFPADANGSVCRLRAAAPPEVSAAIPEAGVAADLIRLHLGCGTCGLRNILRDHHIACEAGDETVEVGHAPQVAALRTDTQASPVINPAAGQTGD